jgi:hypothetical protein
MTVLWLGRNPGGTVGSESQATIKSKSTGEQYKVQIRWVEGQGWQPIGTEKVN